MAKKWYNINLGYENYSWKERERKMERLFTEWELKGKKIKNRICVPPMVCFNWGNEEGTVTEKNVEHYRSIAKGGAGLIIQEATCVSRDGRLSRDQLGIWDDAHVEGLKRIVEAVHEEGVPIVVQIHHAGIITESGEAVCPSEYQCTYKGKERHGRELTVPEIRQIEKDFIDGARRAYEAGYDGVELHGCHNYLLCQFFNRRVNRREDEYASDGMKIVENILNGIREVTPPEFIVGIRLGAFEPEIADGIAHAKWLEAHGIDFINVSYGFNAEAKPEKPEGYPFAEAIYGAKRIKEAVHVPVFAVYGIQNGEMAEKALCDTNADMINIGRGVLVNYNWANDVKEGRDPGRCLYCKTCMWRVDPEKCAGRKLLNGKR